MIASLSLIICQKTPAIFKNYYCEVTALTAIIFLSFDKTANYTFFHMEKRLNQFCGHSFLIYLI